MNWTDDAAVGGGVMEGTVPPLAADGGGNGDGGDRAPIFFMIFIGSAPTNSVFSMPSDKNKLEFIPDAPSLSYAHSNSVGKVFASQPGKLPLLSGKIGFVVREGVDPIEGVSTGRVVEGNAGAGWLMEAETCF
eukprot:1137702-Pelagomonas_calceolata.AAC.6